MTLHTCPHDGRRFSSAFGLSQHVLTRHPAPVKRVEVWPDVPADTMRCPGPGCLTTIQTWKSLCRFCSRTVSLEREQAA